MLKSIFAAAMIFGACNCLYADEAKLGRDDFFSSAISDVVDKVGKVTSGEEPIINRNYRDEDEAGAVRRYEDPAIKPLKRPSAGE